MAVVSWDGPSGPMSHRLGAETHFGRAPQNTVQLVHPSVSGRHACIMQRGGEWVLLDNRSTNGSYVNGQLQSRAVLKDGDEITLGMMSLRFSASDSRPAGIAGLPFRADPAMMTAAGSAAPAQLASSFVSNDDALMTLSSVNAVSLGDERASDVDNVQALAQRLRAALEISRATAKAASLQEALDQVLTALFAIFVGAERSLILLVDAKTEEVSTAAAKHRSGGETSDIAVSRTVLKQAMEKREALLCRDAMADSHFRLAQSIVSGGVRSMMIAPLVFQEEVLGAIYVDTRQGVGQFDPADLQLLSVAAGHVAACLANARLHEQVVQNERLAAVGQTVAGLTHCIKNILQGIQGGAFIVDSAVESGSMDTLARGWDMVKRNNKFMEDLVFDLLSYSKQRPPAYEKTALNALCEEACDLPRARGETRGVTVTFAPDPDVGEVELDPTGIKRCLLNLTMNAVDACAAAHKGDVILETHKPGADGMARILVRDTGPGMPEEVKAKLFTVFFSTKGSKGTGLGLPVSRKIVEEHGGRLEVESELGKGTTFAISLPPTRASRGTDVA